MEIVICDDDPNQRDSIRVCLEISATQYNFFEFELGSDALDHLRNNSVDLIFLDMGLPDMSGLDVLRQLRNFTDAPVIVVSGNDTSESVAQALTIGADDYITKPFAPIELMARVDAVTRRVVGRKVDRLTYSLNGLSLDFDRRTASFAGENVDLNLTEWDLLKTLLSEPGIVVEYSKLKELAWGSDEVSDAAVHMAIRRLRQKLRQDATSSESDGLIRSHRGIGYSINIK
ncbi:MAG: response regulator transcription factor [Chloroflexi bacterium]|jgi:DNA-binding response OmpR family regulator|nr:response regulator transcription factor [Chloroflexota bacterium]